MNPIHGLEQLDYLIIGIIGMIAGLVILNWHFG